MPFKKVGSDDFVSPSGRHFNSAQVRLYHAHGEKFPGQKEDKTMSSKGNGPKEASYAAGGPVLGRSRAFLKIPDQFSDGRLPPKDKDGADDPPQDYGSKGKGSAPKLRNKQV